MISNMLMNSKVYEDIIRNVPKYPPEIGGIMGGKNNIIQCIFFDDGIKTEKYCSYNPNTELLNEVINKWIFQDIEFYGIFHTHFFDVQTLLQILLEWYTRSEIGGTFILI